MIAHLTFIRRLVILLLLTLSVYLSHGQEKAKQAKVGWLLADKITFTPGNQAAGLYVRSDASGNLSLADAVKDSFAIEDLFYVKQTTGVPDSLKLLNAPKNKFWAGPVSGGDSGRPGYRAIELADLPPGIGGSASWGLSGNTGTNPSTNYIGTADNAALSVRANAAEVARFSPDSINFSRNLVLNPSGTGLHSSRQLLLRGRGTDGSYQNGSIYLESDGAGLYGGSLVFNSASGGYTFAPKFNGTTYITLSGDAKLRSVSSMEIVNTNSTKGILIGNDYLQSTGNILSIVNGNAYGTKTPKLVVSNEGNVGIGDSLINPVAKLHVMGDLLNNNSDYSRFATNYFTIQPKDEYIDLFNMSSDGSLVIQGVYDRINDVYGTTFELNSAGSLYLRSLDGTEENYANRFFLDQGADTVNALYDKVRMGINMNGDAPAADLEVNGKIKTDSIEVSAIKCDSFSIGNTWYFDKVIELDSAQIYDLNSSPTEVIPAPGVGKVIEIISASYYYTYGTIPFTSGSRLGLKNISSNLFVADGLTWDSDSYGMHFVSAGSTMPAFQNQPVFLWLVDESEGGGNGKVKLFLHYRILNAL